MSGAGAFGCALVLASQPALNATTTTAAVIITVRMGDIWSSSLASAEPAPTRSAAAIPGPIVQRIVTVQRAVQIDPIGVPSETCRGPSDSNGKTPRSA